MTEISFLDRIFSKQILKKARIDNEEVFLALTKLIQGARAGHLSLSKEELGPAIALLPPSILEEGKDLFPKAPVIFEKNRFYLQKNWVYETYILQNILRLFSNPLPFFFNRNVFENNLSHFVNKLLPAQIEAIRSALQKPLSLICGGPGTGKTHTVAHLVHLLHSSVKREQKKDFYVCVTAPTGKAAAQLQTALQLYGNPDPSLHIEASTLHKLLKLQPNMDRLFRGEKIDADLIVVDEASMLDVPLLAHLLEAIREDSLLVLVGDPNQLPPIGTGSLFAEMSSCFGIQLEQCMRTQDQYLQQLTQAIKLQNSDEFFRLWPSNIETISTEQMIAKIEPVCSSAQPDPTECLKKYQSFRILNAVRRGPQGADALNRQILETVQKTPHWWAAPILATVNDSFHQIYNGMSGVLIGRSTLDANAYFPDPFSGKLRQFSIPPPYELGFCLSIHKSQGSEFDEVLALFPEGSEHFGREALYTAVTRAKKKIEIQGDRKIIQKMLASTSRIASGFSERLTCKCS